MKRTHYSFMEENSNRNVINNTTADQINLPALSGKRSKHCGGGHDKLVGLQNMSAAECSGRERLKRHKEEVAGHVMIPDSWGQEELLKDWIDYTQFDALLVPTGLSSARKALAMEGRRRASNNNGQGVLRIESRC